MRYSVKIAVVDDLPGDREKLCAMLNQYGAAGDIRWEIGAFSSGEELLASFAPGEYAIVFLDILMGGLGGIEVARRLRALDPAAEVVFITTEADYAVEGYEVEAAGFLIKDEIQQKKRFQRLMDRLMNRLKQDVILDFPAYSGALRFPAGAVLYAEVIDHDMRLHVGSQVYTLRMTMEELKSILPEDGRFFECHRGIVLNLDAVDSVGSGVFVMKNGDTLPVSRRRRAELERAYAARSIERVRSAL